VKLREKVGGRAGTGTLGRMFRLGTFLVLSIALLSAACASTGAVPQPFPVPGGVKSRNAPAASVPPADPGAGDVARPVADGYAIAGTALALRGSPYRNGGNDPSGFDCSGFIWYVFDQHGIRVPRTVGEQFREGTEVKPDALEAGDLVFFSTEARGATHVGMVIGGDEFVHAPSSRGDVRVERVSSQYWAARYIGARRVR
jgi:cell wall-associated NlpC family hydrolase